MTESRVRAAALLVALGLAVELVTLGWAHPTAFLVFMGAGGVLMLCGMLLFLSALLRGAAPNR